MLNIDKIRLIIGIQSVLIGLVLITSKNHEVLSHIHDFSIFCFVLGGLFLMLPIRSRKLLFVTISGALFLIFGLSNLVVNYAFSLGLINTATVTYIAELFLIAHVLEILLSTHHIVNGRH